MTNSDAIYAEVPRLTCRRLCGRFCGPIKAGAAEWQRMVAFTGGVEPSARSLMTALRCPFLCGGAECTVHPVRPLVCRLWGAVRGAMECPHGCQPERWLTVDEAWAMLERVGVTREATTGG